MPPIYLPILGLDSENPLFFSSRFMRTATSARRGFQLSGEDYRSESTMDPIDSKTVGGAYDSGIALLAGGGLECGVA